MGLGVVTGVFDQHTARIKRIVEEEFPGCTAIFEQSAWPFLRFHIEDAQGGIVSRTRHFHTIAEMENLKDDRLRKSIQKLRRHT